MRHFLRTAVILVGTLGWWGFVYPELSAVTENYVQETSDEETCGNACREERKAADQGGETANAASGEEIVSFVAGIVRNLGETGIKSGNVRIKSRVMEYLYQGKEKDTTEKETDYDRQKCAYWGV